MRDRLLGAGALVVSVAAALAVWAPARSDESPWSDTAVRARFPDPDSGAGAPKAEDFADNAECKECHEEKVKSLTTSFHGKLLAPGKDDKKAGSHSCQECHGAGQAHVDDGGDSPMRDPLYTADLLAAPPPGPAPAPKQGTPARVHPTVTVQQMNGVCLRCHSDVLTLPRQDHRDSLSRKGEPAAERSCVACHMVHADKSRRALDVTLRPLPTAANSPVEVPAPASRTGDASLVADLAARVHPQMARSGHASLLKEGTDHTCDACHGPGFRRAQSGDDAKSTIMLTKRTRADFAAACSACHLTGKTVEKWTCSEHSRQGVSCVDCHDPNEPKGHTLRRPKGVTQAQFAKSPEFHLCGQCHLDVQAALRLPSRHRVAEGRVSCSDCHDPHGNTDKVRDKDVRYRACLSCHQEKGGPFLFDHGIKRGEGCTACHDPHGSTNRRMLTYPTVQPMCMQCHPETPHDIRKPKYTNCLNCHTEIHGSDFERRFLK